MADLQQAIARRDAALRAAHGIGAPNTPQARALALLEYVAATAQVEQLQPTPARPAPPADAFAQGQAALQAARRRYLLRQLQAIAVDCATGRTLGPADDLEQLGDDALEARWRQHLQQQQARQHRGRVTVEPCPAQVAALNRARMIQAGDILRSTDPATGITPKTAARVAALAQDADRPGPYAPAAVLLSWAIAIHHRHGWSLEARPLTDTLAVAGVVLRLERVGELLLQLQRPAAVATIATRGTSGPAVLPAGAPDRDADPAVIVGPLLPGGGTHAQPLQPEQAPALTLGSEWLDRLRPRAGRLRVLVADDRGVWLGLITDDRMGAQDVPLTHALLARLVPYEPGAVAALEAQARAAAAPSRRRRRKVATTAPGQQTIAPAPAGSPA